MTAALVAARRSTASRIGPILGGITAVVGAMAVGAGIGRVGSEVLAGVLAIGLVVLIAFRPPVGALLLLGVTPLVVGIDRGVLLPVVRPNEALLLVALSGLLLRGLVHVTSGQPSRVRLHRVDKVLVLLAVTGSVLPLLWMYGRGRSITADDVLYAVALWKYLLLYAVVRVSIRTERQVRAALLVAMGGSVVVALVAVLQSLQVPPVTDLLGRWYAPLDDQEVVSIGRGTSTLSSAIAVGDVMAFLLAATIAWWRREPRWRPVMVALATVFVLGGLGSGQFSGAFALVIAVVVGAVLTRSLKRVALAAVPVLIAGMFLLAPVVQTRLEGFQSSEGVPQSWTVRLENLETYFWPEIGADWNWTFGVQTSARVPAPEPWREWVFIESGYTWLLWNGGVPFLAAFVAFLVVAARAVVPIARSRKDAIGVAATASAAALAVLAVLMLFDPHLTMRGTADLSFALLALALTGATGSSRASSSPTSIDGTAPSDTDGRSQTRATDREGDPACLPASA